MFQSKKSLTIVVVALLIVAIAGWSAYYLKKAPTPKSTVPPVLKLTKDGDEKFQGLISGHDLIFKTVSKADSGRYLMDGPKKAKFAKGTGEISAGAAYYYSAEDLEVSDIMGSLIDSNIDSQFLIAYYDQSNNVYRINPPAEGELQTLIFEDAKVESLPDKAIIKKFHPFVIYATAPVESPGNIFPASISLDDVSEKFPALGDLTIEKVLGDSTPSPGWYIIPRRTDITINQFLAPIKTSVVAYYPQKNKGEFAAPCKVDKTCTGIKAGFNFIWLNIGASGVIVDDGTPGPTLCALNGTCGKIVGGQIELECQEGICINGGVTMDVSDLLQVGCAANPKFCGKYGIPDLGKDMEMLYKEGVIPGFPGGPDPSPIEDLINETFEDPVAAGKFVDYATDPLRDLDIAAQTKLGKDIVANMDGDVLGQIAEIVMTAEVVGAIDESALNEAFSAIEAFETETRTTVSKEDAAAFIGGYLQGALNVAGENLSTEADVTAAVGEVITENAEFKGSISGAVESSFKANGALFNAEGLKFDAVNNDFIDINGAGANLELGGAADFGGAGAVKIEAKSFGGAGGF